MLVTTFIPALPPHTFQPFKWIFIFPSSILLPPHQQPFVLVSPLSVPHSPHLLYRRETPSTWTSSTSATRQPLPLKSTPHTACLRLPPFTASISPPFCHPWTAPRGLSAPGGLAHSGSLRLPCAPASPYMCFDITPRMFWFLFFVEGHSKGPQIN